MASFLDNHWGDLASVVGAIISFFGFILAIRLILKAATAAKAAKVAALDTKAALARNLTIEDLARASQRLEDIKSLHRDGAWQRALDRYYDVRRLLAETRSRHPDLTNRQKRALQGAIQHLTDIETDVESASIDGKILDVARLNGPIIEAQNVLDEVMGKLRQSI